MSSKLLECQGQFAAWDLEVRNKHSEKIECRQTSCCETRMKQHAVQSTVQQLAMPRQPRLVVRWATTVTESSDGASSRLAHAFQLWNINLLFSICKTHHETSEGVCSSPVCAAELTELKGRFDVFPVPFCELLPHSPAKELNGFVNSGRKTEPA